MHRSLKALHLFISLFFYFQAHSQSPGLIVREPGGSGITALNPDGNAYSSLTTGGFTSDDIAQSEIPFNVVPVAIIEPTGDLATGPSGGYTDIVSRVDGSGFYLYKDATNIYFRLRIGGILTGSKGYSVLIDTDSKIGSSGAYADPNFVAPSGNAPGNPGFEYEVVLQTNFQVAVYNINGTASPGTPATYSLTTNSQISAALSTDGGNPDYFYDWFVPLSAIGTPGSIRVAVTTVTSPNSSLQGSRSDIYGVNDNVYPITSSAWEAVVNAQPSINLTSYSGVSATCTAAPVLNSPISTGSNISVTGTWTRLDATKQSTATITLFRNGASVGTTSVSTGNTWSINVSTIASGDVFYAKASASGESECLNSNQVLAAGCTNKTSLTGVSVSCGTVRGFDGQAPSGTHVRIYTVTTSGYTLFADETTTTYKVSHPANGVATRWTYDGPNTNNADPCSGGAPDVPSASYAITVQQTGQCESDYFTYCNNLTQTATPTITQTLLYNTSTVVSGTAAASALMRLFINGSLYGTTTANGSGQYTFSSLVLTTGDIVQVSAQSSGLCVSARASLTVSCLTISPSITTDNNGNLIAGATVIAGKSVEPPGTTIRVYNSSNTLIGATTVEFGGIWTLSATVTAGTSYYATAQNGTCNVSASSSLATALSISAVCPTITGSPTDASTSVSGTLPSSFTGTVRLYQDGVQIGAQSVTAATNWTISGLANTLYYNGILRATAQPAGSAESTGCTTATVACTSPSTPSISPASATIETGETVTFTVSNVTANTWYVLLDNSGVSYATSSYRTNSSNFSLQTNVFNSPGAFSLNLSADKLSGCPASIASASITVNSPSLPVEFIHVSANKTTDGTEIAWKVANETNLAFYTVERSLDGVRFQAIGQVNPQSGTGIKPYSFTDDLNSGKGYVYYRIRETDHDGHFEYSNIVSLFYENKHVLTIQPNPATDQITVRLYEYHGESLFISLLDLQGKQLLAKTFLPDSEEATVRIDELSGILPGSYFLKVVSASGGVSLHKVVLQGG